MQIKMLADAQGSECGIKVKSFVMGEVYEVVDSLGNAFVNMKVAKQVTKDSIVNIEIESEEKMVEKPIENKALTKDQYQNKSSKKAK